MKKMIALVVTLTLVGAFALNATMAYLTGETKPVENVFVIGDINITLSEEQWTKQGADFKGKVIPGETIVKDPTVTVKQASEDCYLFVCLTNTLAVPKVSTGTSSTDSGNWDYVTPNINDPEKNWDFVTYSVDSTGAKKELYRYKEVLKKCDVDVTVPFFTKVTVPGDSFTKESMQELAKKETKMTVEAFAHQSKNVSEDDATKAAKTKFFPSPTSPST